MRNKLSILALFMVLSLVLAGCSDPVEEPVETDPVEEEPIEVNKPETDEPVEVEPEPEVEEVVEVVEPSYGLTLKITSENPTTLDPIENTSKSVDEVLKLVYEPLFRVSETGEMEPVLVESYDYEVTKDALNITLKSGLTFHDGTALTANDIKFTVDHIKDLGGIYGDKISNIDYVDAVDDVSLIIYFKEHYSMYLFDLSFPIVSGMYIKGDTYDPLIANGSGMYFVSEMTSMQTMVLSYFDAYIGTEPYASTIEVLINRDESAESTAFDQQLVDVFVPTVLNWQTYSELNVRPIEYTTEYIEVLGFNNEKELLKDKNIRQAIAYGIDRAEIAEVQYLSHAVVTDSLLQPSSYLNTEEALAYTYDTSLALDALTASNITNLSLKMIVNEDNAIRLDTGLMIQYYLSEIGIELDLVKLDREAYSLAIETSDYDLVLLGFKMSTKPDYIPLLHSVHGSYNITNYQSEEMDRVLESIYTAGTTEQMISELANFQELYVETLPFINLCYLNSAVLVTDQVYGEMNANTEDVYSGIEQLYIAK